MLAAQGATAAPAVQWDGAEIQSLAARIAKEHGVQKTPEVRWTVTERDKLRGRLRELVTAQYTPEEIVDEGRLLVRLGLLPAGTPYDEVIYGLLEEQILGLYDPGRKELMLLQGTPQVMLEGVMVHELTHAVQDMNFDLDALTERRPGMGDRNAALEAVAEGDALLMEQVLSGLLLPAGITAEQMKLLMQLAPLEGPVMSKTPGFIQSILVFPYLYGFVLVRAAHAGGGFGAVNALFESPPESTEQVLHPERMGLDPPVDVHLEVPAGLSGLYRLAVDDVMGEFALGAWLEEWILPQDAQRAASGWGGDRYLFLWPRSVAVGEDHLDHGAIVMLTRWDAGPADDPHAEAREFAAALLRYIEARHPGSKRQDTPQSSTFTLDGGQIAIVEHRAGDVLFIEGLPVAAAAAVRSTCDEIWAGTLSQ